MLTRRGSVCAACTIGLAGTECRAPRDGGSSMSRSASIAFRALIMLVVFDPPSERYHSSWLHAFRAIAFRVVLVSSPMIERMVCISVSVKRRPEYFQMRSLRSRMFHGKCSDISSGALPPNTAHALR